MAPASNFSGLEVVMPHNIVAGTMGNRVGVYILVYILIVSTHALNNKPMLET